MSTWSFTNGSESVDDSGDRHGRMFGGGKTGSGYPVFHIMLRGDGLMPFLAISGMLSIFLM